MYVGYENIGHAKKREKRNRVCTSDCHFEHWTRETELERTCIPRAIITATKQIKIKHIERIVCTFIKIHCNMTMVKEMSKTRETQKER